MGVSVGVALAVADGCASTRGIKVSVASIVTTGPGNELGVSGSGVESGTGGSISPPPQPANSQTAAMSRTIGRYLFMAPNYRKPTG